MTLLLPAFMASTSPTPPSPPSGTSDLATSTLNAALVDSGGEFEIYHVTNENTSGAGSYDAAVTTLNTAANGRPVTRIVVFDICGGVRYPTNSNANGPNIERQFHQLRGNLFVAGETAPTAGDGSGAGFNVHGYPRLDAANCSNIVFRHVRFIPSAPGGAINDMNNYEAPRGFVVNPNSDLENIVLQNCEVNHGIDTSVYLNPVNPAFVTNFVMVNCVIAEALSDAEQATRSDLVFGHQFTFHARHHSDRVLVYGTLVSCMSARTPLTSDNCTTLWTNNFLYNCGGPGAVSNVFFTMSQLQIDFIDSGDYNYIEWSHNAFRGGAQSNPQDLADEYFGYFAPSLQERGDVHGYAAGNRFYTKWDATYTNGPAWDSVSTNLNAGFVYDATASATPAFNGYHGTYDHLVWEPHSLWGADAGLTLPTTIKPASEVESYVMTYAGATPANRDANSQRIFDDIVAETARVRVGECPTFADPTLTTAAVDVPDGLGTVQLAGGDGTHPAVTGYDAGQVTGLEQWLHDRHMAALGIPSGAADYDPDVVGRWLSTTALPTLA